MASPSETGLWRWLETSRRSYRDRLHMTRVENSISSGTPDVEGCLDGRQFWIELKCVATPKSRKTLLKPKFQLTQPAWIYKRWRVGGNVFILLQVGSGLLGTRYLIRGTDLWILTAGASFDQLENASLLLPSETASRDIIYRAAYYERE